MAIKKGYQCKDFPSAIQKSFFKSSFEILHIYKNIALIGSKDLTFDISLMNLLHAIGIL